MHIKTKSSNKAPWIVTAVLAIALIIVAGITLSRRNSGTAPQVPASASSNSQVPQTPQQSSAQQYPNTAPSQVNREPTATNTNSSSSAVPVASSSVVLPNTGVIKGTVTFYFNSNFGNKPDVGADVWLVDAGVDIPEDCFFSATASSRTAYISQREINGGQRVELPIYMHTSVDGNGTYEINDVPSGQYTLIIQSKHTIGSPDGRAVARDVVHRIDCNQVTVKAGKTSDISHDFGMSTF